MRVTIHTIPEPPERRPCAPLPLDGPVLEQTVTYPVYSATYPSTCASGPFFCPLDLSPIGSSSDSLLVHSLTESSAEQTPCPSVVSEYHAPPIQFYKSPFCFRAIRAAELLLSLSAVAAALSWHTLTSWSSVSRGICAHSTLRCIYLSCPVFVLSVNGRCILAFIIAVLAAAIWHTMPSWRLAFRGIIIRSTLPCYIYLSRAVFILSANGKCIREALTIFIAVTAAVDWHLKTYWLALRDILMWSMHCIYLSDRVSPTANGKCASAVSASLSPSFTTAHSSACRRLIQWITQIPWTLLLQCACSTRTDLYLPSIKDNTGRALYFGMAIALSWLLLLPTYSIHSPINYPRHVRMGGGARQTINGRVLAPYILNDNGIESWMHSEYTFEFQCRKAESVQVLLRHERCVSVAIPLPMVSRILTKLNIIHLAKLHNMWVPSKLSADRCKKLIDQHTCESCGDDVVSIFECIPSDIARLHRTSEISMTKDRAKKQTHGVVSRAKVVHDTLERRAAVRKLRMLRKKLTGRLNDTVFPPLPLARSQTRHILAKHCRSMRPKAFKESGCAVCGCLVPARFLTPLSKFVGSLALLIRRGVTRKERFGPKDPIEELNGPVLASGRTDICVDCETSLNNGVVPKIALVCHNWIGDVPEALQNLTYAEGIMIARIRHNRCVIRVNSGRVRMSANAIMFSQPVLSIMKKLPPSKDEMNEILAFVFTGSAAPTQEDFERTPMLVRKKVVVRALEWLTLNHEGYADCEISRENLSTYAERDIPVVVDWKQTKEEVHDSVPAGASAGYEMPKEQGTRTGKCSFAVHGLTGTEYATATMKTIKSVALQHLTHKGGMLGIGRSEVPVSMYDDVTAYPGMFPWLFPYGKGGIGHPSHANKSGDLTRKRSLLMYYDKRFQVDTYFPMIAFNHEQLKAASTHSLLLAKRAKFNGIARRLSAVNPVVAGDIADRMAKGENVKPNNHSEQICFDLIKDLDGVAGHVDGSVTSKKYQRNEIWSTTAFNAPTWFVTVAWNDLHHPLALYYAQTDTVYRPEVRTSTSGNTF